MRVLWITNIVLPEAEQLLGGAGVLRATGGWMSASANALCERDVELAIASVSAGVDHLVRMEGGGRTYYLLPAGRGNTRDNPEYLPFWKEIKKEFHPDIVHIHGTEFTHGLAYLKACGPSGVVVSIQGILTEYAAHYFDGMSLGDIVWNTSLRDIIKGEPVWAEERDFRKRSVFEREMLRSVSHVIGRTDWDRTFVKSVNPSASYHFCNETLRQEFYSDAWHHQGNYRAFVSQASYPLKGFHQLIKAVSRMGNKPEVCVAGYNIADVSTFSKRLKIRSYGLYLNRLMRRLGVSENFRFLGPLDASGMKAAMLSADVCICPSALENSSNSIGEAQLLGVPVIASRRGGTPSVVKDGKSGFLYDFEDTAALAALIEQMLSDDCSSLSVSERAEAAARHSPLVNADTLIRIYEDIYRNL